MKVHFKFLLLGLLLPASYLAAQEFTGSVADSTGAVVAEATITAHEVQ